MYLEKLSIQGFKSFANKNELVFPGALKDGKHGLTAIVGPNGSGKSNVADAVRWALGEQSMKTLRGKKSEDVIFSGSDKKGQLGMAEVSLFLNNHDSDRRKSDSEKSETGTDGFLDYADVVLTRRLYRDGASDYLINGSRVRLLDVQMLLAKANFGQKTYSVIGQGMVENFLNTSLAERKEFFDEATGVKQYQIKRDDALNKLRLSIENLSQSQMLMTEIEPRLKTLSRQMARLEKKGQYLTELEELQLNYYAHQWQNLNNLLQEIRQRMAETEKALAAKQLSAEKLEEELTAMAGEDSVGNQFDDIQEELSRVRATADRLSRLAEYLRAWSDLGESGFDERAWEEERMAIEAKLKTARQNLSSEDVTDDTERINELTAQIATLERQRLELMKEAHRLDAWIEMKLESLGKFDLSFLNNRRNELKANLEQADKEQKELATEITAAEDKLKSSKNRQSADAEAFNRLNDEWKELSGRGYELAGREVNDRLNRSLTKLEAVALENDLKKIKTVLAEIKQEIKEAIGFSTGRELKERLKRLETDLSQAAEERERWRAEISALELKINSVNEKRRLLSNQTERWQNELHEVEKKLQKGEEKFDAGSAQAERAEVNHRQERLAEEIKTLTEELSGLKLSAERRRAAKQAAIQQADALEREMNSWQGRYAQAKLNIARQEARREETENRLKQMLPEIELTETAVGKAVAENDVELKRVQERAQILKDKLSEFNAMQESKRRKLLDCQQALQAAQTDINRLSSGLNDEKVKAVRYETRLEDLEIEIHENYDHLVRLKTHKVGESFEADETLNRIKHLRHQVELIGSVDDDLEQEYAETKERFDFLFHQVDDLTNTIKSLEEVIRELDGTIRVRFDKEFDHIAGKFEEYFKILFNGGSAKIIKVTSDELDETEGPEPVEGNMAEVEADSPVQTTLKKLKVLSRINATGLAGIDISATPPGKKIKSISMLSGGERALTAIALICAIISANPSPFVVLDEVDAALDEANSERLARILDDLSGKTQFIVITHNRAPMRKAVVLYGVTMQDDGVSKLLSVKLEEVKVDK